MTKRIGKTAAAVAGRGFGWSLVALAALAVAGAAGVPARAQSSSSSTQTQVGQNAPGTAPIAPRAAEALAPQKGPRYDEKWDLFGGLSFMNGQAGQNLPKRYNMGGGELTGVYWLGPRWGVAADYRLELGTTPVLSPYYNRVLVYQNVLSGGVQMRGPHGRYVATGLHGYAGGTYGVFDHAMNNYPGGSPVASCAANQTASQKGNVGLYCNGASPFIAAGANLDFNQGPRFAIRISPDLIMEHFGTELREFVSVGGGVVWHFGKR